MTDRTARLPGLMVLGPLTGLSVLSLNMFLPSLPNIAAEFRADHALVNLSIAGYLAVTAVLQIVIGPLSDRYGRRPVLLVSLAVFVAASLGCALAPDIWSFLGFRLFQGVIIGGWVLSIAAIRDTHAPEGAASRIGYISMAMAVAPMLGPVLGGLLDEAVGWRAVFWFYTGFGALLLALCWALFAETNRVRAATLLAQIRSYPELFRSPRFWGYALAMAFATSAFYTYLSGVPLVAAGQFGIAPSELGLFMASTAAGFFTGSEP